MIKFLLNKINIQKFLVFLFLGGLFFPIRHVFLTSNAFLTGGYSDFTSFSLYLSDIIVLMLFFGLIISRGREFWSKLRENQSKNLSLLPCLIFLLSVFWLILGFFQHFDLNIRLNSYFFIKWLELAVSYGTLRILFPENGLKIVFFRFFAWFCALQSVIALSQFAKQSSLGLYRLGESHLAPNVLGVAKIVSSGTTYIRGYGTFPHPNLLGAFLVAGVLMAIYLLLDSISLKSKVAYSIILFLNILGLTVTFSRGAYLALGVGLVIFFGYLFWRKTSCSAGPRPALIAGQVPAPREKMDCSSSAVIPMAIVIASIVVTGFLFKPFLLTRATFSDQSTVDRKFYDEIGLKMIETNPIAGVGLGESVLHMEQYANKSLESWEKQPPHNYFIIAAAELGIPGALILLWIFLFHLWQIIKRLKLETNVRLITYHLSLIAILSAFLLLMLFDHYFYTLEQTQLLLWIILGLIAAETPSINKKNI